jgi:polyhydroxybutyrate depolymerase
MSRSTKAVLAVTMVVTALSVAFPALADCLDKAGPCKIATGEYHIVRPAGTNGKVPAVMFLHGYGSNGAETMKNVGMVNSLLARGYAVIAPSGRAADGTEGKEWSFNPDWPQTRDETVFLRAVLDDAAAKYGIDRDQILLAGFSIGGSMVAYAACKDPSLAKAYAPVAGNFWRPYPTSCAGPVKMLHTHGWVDSTMPLEGRSFGKDEGMDRDVAQGDAFHSMELWRATNKCSKMAPDTFEISGQFWHRRWESCAEGSALEFVLWPGTHAIPKGWADMALKWFEKF